MSTATPKLIKRLEDIPKGYKRKRITAEWVENIDLDFLSMSECISILENIMVRSKDKAKIRYEVDEDLYDITRVNLTAVWEEERLETDNEFMLRVQKSEMKKYLNLTIKEQEKMELERLINKYKSDAKRILQI